MKKRVKPIPAAIAFLILIPVLVYTVFHIIERTETKEPSGTNMTEGSSGTEELLSPENGTAVRGFVFSEVFSYSGPFTEDGTDDPVENVAAVKVRNLSDEDCQYAKVTLTTENAVYEFAFTTLLKGETVTVLEQNRKAFAEKGAILGAAVDNLAVFEEPPQRYPDVFELTVMDKVINIRNISDKDIGGTVYVCYKNTVNGELFGGITYRISVDSLKAGELKQMSSQHLSAKNSVMEFITYVP